MCTHVCIEASTQIWPYQNICTASSTNTSVIVMARRDIRWVHFRFQRVLLLELANIDSNTLAC